jgi:hypothetical protein
MGVPLIEGGEKFTKFDMASGLATGIMYPAHNIHMV